MRLSASLRSVRVDVLATVVAVGLGLIGAAAVPGHAVAADSGQFQQITGARADVADILAAANSGDASAQLTLGYAYALGDGVIQDYVEAHKWFNLAGANGNKLGIKNRDRLADRLSSTQLAEAHVLARAWHHRHAASARSVGGSPLAGSVADVSPDAGEQEDSSPSWFSRWFGSRQ